MYGGRGGVREEATFPRLLAERDASPPPILLGVQQEQVLTNLARIRLELADAAVSRGRDPREVTLVAAAKRVPPGPVSWVVDAGVSAIGENYVQELSEKREALEGLAVRWHFIGTLQSGTAHRVADLADVVETVSGERAARRLAGRAARSGKTLDVLIEVDFTGERAGVPPGELEAFTARVAAMEGLKTRGLMTLPPLPEAPEDSRKWFRALRELRDGLRENHPEVLELSMGMSLDYGVAVQEGATMVRIGSALFGPRQS